jgi:hypothetical protein
MDYPGYTVTTEVEDDGWRTEYPHVPHSPELPDVTRDGGDFLPGEPWPTEQTPEPAGKFRQDMHTHTPLDSILEARGSRYGAFADNAFVAQGIKRSLETGVNYCGLADDQLEALDQIAAKISRIVTGDPDYVDNWDDIAGYAKLVADRLRRHP